MTPQQRLLVLGATGAILAAPFVGMRAAPAAPAPAGPPVFRSTCIGCHSVDKTGRMPRLDGVRATPEEWDAILRRMGRRGLTLSEAERHAMVKEISRFQSLTPEENAAVGYMNISPAANLQERVPDVGDFRRTCTTCHSFGKIASYRRSPEDWAYIKDFHLGMFPATFTQSYRDMQWWESAGAATTMLAHRFPYDDPAYKAWKAAHLSIPAAGAWVVAGHEAGVGDYDAVFTLKAKGDDEFDLLRMVTYADGHKATAKGTATLFGGGALRCQWTAGGHTYKAAYTIAPPGRGLGTDPVALEGGWSEVHAVQHYATERGARKRATRGQPVLLRLSPSWVRPNQGKVTVVATTDGPTAASWAPRAAVKGLRYLGQRVIDATHVAFTLDVGNVAPGTPSLGLGQGPLKPIRGLYQPKDQLVVARGIDYIKITPEKAVARLGGIAVPPDGVPFEAIAMSNGPDGKRHTADDVALGMVPATWAIQEYFYDLTDDDVPRVGKIDAHGLFMPANEAPDPTSPTLGKNGNVWVVATFKQPGKAPLQARAYLNVAFPDLVKPIH